MYNTEWELNAELRYRQLMSGEDITYSNIFLPFWVQNFKENNYRNVIEIGSGPGVLTKELAEYTNKLVSIEPDKNMYQIAAKHNQEKANVCIENKSIEDFKEDMKFDLCFAHMVFHNIKDLNLTLNIISNLLCLDGELVFSVPHPCFYHFYKNKELGNLDYMQVSENKIKFNISKNRNSLPSKITYIHRNLEEYISVLHENHFTISNIKEVYPEPNTMKLYDEEWEYPRYIIFKTKLLSH